MNPPNQLAEWHSHRATQFTLERMRTDRLWLCPGVQCKSTHSYFNTFWHITTDMTRIMIEAGKCVHFAFNICKLSCVFNPLLKILTLTVFALPPLPLTVNSTHWYSKISPISMFLFLLNGMGNRVLVVPIYSLDRSLTNEQKSLVW